MAIAVQKPARAAAGSVAYVRQLLERKESLSVLLLAPAILYIFALIGVPFCLALYYSFTDVTTGSTRLTFVGLQNFISIFDSSTFVRALRNTFVFAFASQLLVLVLGKILALALHKSFPGKTVVRFLILLPWVSPIALGTIGWKWMYDSLYSVVNWSLQALGILGPNVWPMWLGEPTLAMIAVVLVHVWRTLPFAAVIILAGITAIPQEVLDAAAVDGANARQRLFHVTIPLLLPIMCVTLLFGTIFTFTDMAVIYVLTRGGPYDTTQVLGSLAFFVGILGGDLGEGAAIALFLFPLLALVAIVMLRIARRTEVD
jgi:multiple sugar transport system permease protein